MLCTDCGREIKPIVCVDIDGTLGDFHSHLINFAKQYFQMDPNFLFTNKFTGKGRMRDWFMEQFHCSLNEYHEMKLAYRQGGLKRSMPCEYWASDLTQSIHEALGAELWLTTTRPYLRLDSVDPDTRFWLHRHDIYYDHLLYDDDKFGRLKEIVDERRIVAVLDDLDNELGQAEFYFGVDVCILKRSQFNRTHWDKWEGYEHRGDIFRAIHRRVASWQPTHVSTSGSVSDISGAEQGS